jgi:DNA-binding LacI/PurR family transcriptional regulator
MGVSIKDVAQRAGVSAKTVSNVIHEFPHVTPMTKAKVLEAIDDLGYRPSGVARMLRGGSTGIIVLGVPDISSPYFAELTAHLVREAERYAWRVLLYIIQDSEVSDRLLRQGIRQHRVDGLIVSPLSFPGDLGVREDSTPLVILGEDAAAPMVDSVGIDEAAATRAATAHLVEVGRRRIALLVGRRSPGDGSPPRLLGYRQALETAGLAFDAQLVIPTKADGRADGYDAMTALLLRDDPPDGVVCSSELLAAGALRALLAAGRRVPQDTAVVGLGGTEAGAFFTPTLTSVYPDKAQIARLALALLKRRTTHPEASESRTERIPFRMVVRQSTAGAGAGAAATTLSQDTYPPWEA